MDEEQGITALGPEDLGTVEVTPNVEETEQKESAFPQFTDEAKRQRGIEGFKSFKKGFKQALPYLGQLGLDLKTGSGIAEFFGQQYDVVQGEKRPSYFEAAKRTSDLISQGKVTDAIVSGVDQTLTAVGGIGEGVMAAGVMLGPAGLPLLAGGWVANQISKRGKAILTNTKTGQRVLANFSGDTEKGFNIESIDVPKGKDENQIIDSLGEVVDKNIVPVNKVEMTDADFESVPTPEQKIGQGTLKEAGFNPSQATAFWVQSGYSKAFPDLTRNEVANVLLDNPQAMKESQDAISKIYTPTIKDGKEFYSVFRRVPLKGKEGLETSEAIISGTLDPRVLPRYSMSSTMDQPESIIRDKTSKGARLSEMGMPMDMKKGYDAGKEIIVRYDVPKDKIIGYVPELVKANNTRGAKAKIEKTYDVKLDTDKNKLGFYKSLERNAANEQEVFADVRGIQPTIVKNYKGGIEAIRNDQTTNIVLKSDKKTGAEILEDEGGIGRYSVLDDKFLKGAPDDPRAILKGSKAGSKGEEKFGLIPNPKYGKGAKEINENFEKANIEELDKRLDFVKQEFNLNQLEKPKQDEGIKALEQKDITPSGFKFEPADPKSRRMYGRTYISEDESLGLIEIGVDGYSTKRLYAVNAMVDGKPRNIGKVTLSQSTIADDKKIDDLINIELNDDVRGKGFGEKIVKGLVNYSSRPEGLSIRDIKRNALPFWKKLGINFYEGGINRQGKIKKYGFIPNESGMKNVKYKTPDELKKEQQDEGIKQIDTENKGLGYHKNPYKTSVQFFNDVVDGKAKPLKQYEYIIDVGRSTNEFSPYNNSVINILDSKTKNFANHINTSIPTFKEAQIATIQAASAVLPKNAKILDIGPTEGGFMNTLGKVRKDIEGLGIEPSEKANRVFGIISEPNMKTVKNAFSGFKSEYNQKAFKDDVDADIDITVFDNDTIPDKSLDMVSEKFTFQFIDNERASKIDVISKKLKDDGFAIFEEKFVPNVKNKEYEANEAKKDKFKSNYYKTEDMTKKKEEVLLGMEKNMVDAKDFEDILKGKFKHVVQYWDSGNFSGYIVSNSEDTVKNFLSNMPSLKSEYSNVKPNRVVQGMTTKKEKVEKKALGGFIERNTYDWVYLDG